MKNKGNKQKSKKKGNENVFGCDLIELLQNSGQDVPQVLKKCAEFIEKFGIVDGIYRLSGVTSNIQRLRQEFCSEVCPDLTKEVYLQDIHCVGSLCKLYFRELPNPLLTFELYSKFTGAVSVQGDHERLLHIQSAVKELPTAHFRTLEYLTKHLAHLATLSSQTNMHTRNLALVWAPNLLRSKDIEASSGNGDMAFQEVRIQQSVIEFILNHVEQIFNSDPVPVKAKEGPSLLCGEKKYATLPISGQCGPMKLMSLEEAQARSLSPNHPVHKERQRENSLPDTSTATLYHTVIEISDHKRRFSGKSKKWKSIFNLGKSVDSKGKLSRNGSVLTRGQGVTEKAALRSSRSMESLCISPPGADRPEVNNPVGGSSSVFIPDVKSRTLGSDSLCDLTEHDPSWEVKEKTSGGATAVWSSSMNQKDSSGASSQKSLPEQLKVFKGDDLSSYKPSSPKSRRMLYAGYSHSNSSRPSFPGSFFPLESSPRHQRRAINISEPFAVSVPLRVSAVISSNSTPCRVHSKDKAATLRSSKEPSEQSSNFKKSNTFPLLEPKRQEGTEKKLMDELAARASPDDTSRQVMQKDEGEKKPSDLEALPHALPAGEGKDTDPPSGEERHQPTQNQLDRGSSTGKEVHPELKITEPETNLLDASLKPVFFSTSACVNPKLTMDVKSKRSRSSPSLSLLCREPSQSTPPSDHVTSTRSDCKKKQPSEPDLLFVVHKNIDLTSGGKSHNLQLLDASEQQPRRKVPALNKNEPPYAKQSQRPAKEASLHHVMNHLTLKDLPQVANFSVADSTDRKHETHHGDKEMPHVIPETDAGQRLSVCLEEKHASVEPPNLEDEEGCGEQMEELDLVEPWDDLSSTKQWVTSPLHSPDIEELLNQLSPFSPQEATLSSEGNKHSSLSADDNKQSVIRTDQVSGNPPPTVPMRARETSNNATQPQAAKCNTTKQKNTVSSQRFNRQTSFETVVPERREENRFCKHRPYSLNLDLDLGHRYIRDISNQQNCKSSEFSLCQKGSLASAATGSKGHSELDLFLNDRQAPLRRNSAPVSVSSVRTAFMIKTCQAKAVPVIPPKVQYSQIPRLRHEGDSNPVKEQEKGRPKISAETSSAAPPLPLMLMSDLPEQLENKKPGPKQQKTPSVQKSAESVKTTSTPELPVITRRLNPNLEVFVDCPRPNRANLLQRPSFRNRQRPQSLILLSPPFPIMDYPPSGDDGRLLSSIKNLNDTSALLSKENFRTSEGISLHNKMTIPKSGQRLETSTSCFYQPQRRSMIFDSRSHRQIE
ncbi:rho GTPase-activating protein 31 [Nothobranchius furzeri]|uniref:Rho GTPase activating protein 31 n=5 Tax=Nothobranchius TaxID=28779 RepID=A0A1A8AQF7_NOTFU|nr:rho GTPase-activating protein 31 [Nothobranchius furzeri]KAF7205771.1 Rho GTPase activating protein 31 [Nothobranchius furzeri]